MSGNPVDLYFSTHTVGSANYTISAGLGLLWENYLSKGSTVDVQPTSPGGMGAPYLFADNTGEKPADIAFVNGAPAKWAYEQGTLGRPPTKAHRALVGSMSGISAVNFLSNAFMKKYHITTVEEAIRPKLPIRIGCSPKGSMDERVVEMLLSFMGVTYDDVKKWGGDVIHGGGSDLAALVRDNKIDFMLDHTAAESATMNEIAMTTDITFLQWEEATLKWFETQGFERITIKAGTWKNQAKDVVNAGSPDCIFVNVKMADDVAYTLTKAMCEQQGWLLSQYPSMSFFHPETAWEPGRVGGVPLHPGAERYYREKGYMK
jgi:TRAP transporter TAXI family solute receptor